MRKIILMLSVSLDGFFEGPNRELDWQLVDDELHEHFNEVLGAKGAFLSGRVTYELMAEFWPTADEDPASTKPMVEFADLARHAQDRLFDQAGSRGLEHHRGPRRRAGRRVEAQGTARRRPRPRWGGPRGNLHAIRPDRRVPALRAFGDHRTREEAVRA